MIFAAPVTKSGYGRKGMTAWQRVTIDRPIKSVAVRLSAAVRAGDIIMMRR
jgi:hypothetical protein